MKLPSQHILRDYTHHVKSNVGFSGEVDQHLAYYYYYYHYLALTINLYKHYSFPGS